MASLYLLNYDSNSDRTELLTLLQQLAEYLAAQTVAIDHKMSELDADSYSDDPYTKECRLAKRFDLIAFEIFAFVFTFKARQIQRIDSENFAIRRQHERLCGLLRLFSLTWTIELSRISYDICWAKLALIDQIPQWREKLLAWQNPHFPGNYRQTMVEAFTQEDWERLWNTKTKWDEQITSYEELEREYDLEREQWE